MHITHLLTVIFLSRLVFLDIIILIIPGGTQTRRPTTKQDASDAANEHI
jgi:hypothetical protein